mgnify:CR=1 FL=1
MLSDDDSLDSSLRLGVLSNPNELLEEDILEEQIMVGDDNYMLDITQDLPIRKPQSAYVIFGKMVSELRLIYYREETTSCA